MNSLTDYIARTQTGEVVICFVVNDHYSVVQQFYQEAQELNRNLTVLNLQVMDPTFRDGLARHLGIERRFLRQLANTEAGVELAAQYLPAMIFYKDGYLIERRFSIQSLR